MTARVGRFELILAVICASALMLVSRPARADDEACHGPEACCPAHVDTEQTTQSKVGLGIVLVGMANVDERSGTWTADFYERWTPKERFTPHTEVANEVERKRVSFDTTEMRGGSCVRSRRIQSVLRTPYNLRTFPFDSQDLVLEFSDDDFTTAEVQYESKPYLLGLDGSVRTTITGWKLEDDPSFRVESRPFAWEPGSPNYDYASVHIPIRRHVSFHLLRYFLPLLIIVIVSFSVFWIDPDELNSSLSVGVTCVLAAIALQLAEGGALPAVSYLTLADRIYVVCYVAIAATIMEVVYVNALSRSKRRERAVVIARKSRLGFPALVVVCCIASAIRSFTQT